MVYPLNNHLFFVLALLAIILMIALILVIIGFPESVKILFSTAERVKPVHEASSLSKEGRNQEKRAHERIPLPDTTINVTDGYIFCTALLDNISAYGVCLKNLPDTLYKNSENLTLFSHAGGELPVLHVRPQWEQKDRSGKRIGARILNSSEKWLVFLNRCQPIQGT